jgi:hypothetical protein
MSYVLHNTANIDGYIKSASFFFTFIYPIYMIFIIIL